MTESLSSKIKNIEARMNRLKTAGLRSAASITTITKTIQFQVRIVPYKVNYEWDSCASEYSYRIHIEWADNIGLCEAYIKSPANLANRRYALNKLTNSGHDFEYGFNIINGSDEDLEIFNSGGSVPPFTVTLAITATADFQLSYTSRREH